MYKKSAYLFLLSTKTLQKRHRSPEHLSQRGLLWVRY